VAAATGVVKALAEAEFKRTAKTVTEKILMVGVAGGLNAAKDRRR